MVLKRDASAYRDLLEKMVDQQTDFQQLVTRTLLERQRRFAHGFAAFVAAWMLVTLLPVHAVSDQTWVAVREPGNPPDPVTKAGQVGYAFEIMSTEVPNWLYCDFLNAVAGHEDPHGLYTPLLADHFFGGIVRSSASDGFTYACKPGFTDLPVVFVSWFDAVRFANWLHFGQPRSVRCALGTTEGDDRFGAYDTRDFPDALLARRSAHRRHSQARYWLPDQDEWLKAAFYGGQGKWWRYATQSDALPDSCSPTQAQAREKPNAANYYGRSWAAPFPHLTPVGAYPCPSWAGTFDQNGNAFEWVETLVSDASGFRRALGGAVFRYANSLERGYLEGDRPDRKISTIGFRVARRLDADRLAPVRPEPRSESLPVAAARPAPAAATGAYVRVAHAGNPPDPFYGWHGAVAHEFEIARCELSNDEYADFLNAVAVQADPFGLYNPDMATGALGGIERTSSSASGPWQYTAKPQWARRPVNYISWFDLARYANWQHFGQPRSGRAEAGTTEGTDTLGAYDTSAFEALRSGQRQPWRAFGRRNRGARYWIPDEDEWYKAAYYDPERTGMRSYWDFPVRSDDLPDNPPPPGGARSVNYQPGVRLAAGPPYYLAEVDAYPEAVSFCGTLQQGGNVWEWLESWQYGRRLGIRGLRGGSFGYTELGLHACNCDPGMLTEETYVFGGRLARAVTPAGWQPVRLPHRVILRRSLDRMGLRDWLMVAAISGLGGLLVGVLAGRVWRQP